MACSAWTDYIAKLGEICDLAEKYDALVMVDDSHATGFVGKTGRGTPEHRDVMGRIDIITSTLGKALGGASGGFTAATARDHRLFPPAFASLSFLEHAGAVDRHGGARRLDLLEETTELRDKLETNTTYFREQDDKAGFDIKEGTHPIVPDHAR